MPKQKSEYVLLKICDANSFELVVGGLASIAEVRKWVRDNAVNLGDSQYVISAFKQTFIPAVKTSSSVTFQSVGGPAAN